MARTLHALLRKDHGSAAVEFALVLPVLVVLVFGIYHLCFAMYAAASVRWTVEQTARCGAISQANTGLSCGTRALAATYARSVYSGPRLSSISFTPSDDTTNKCRKVHGQGTYPIHTGVLNVNVPISADACYPANTSVAWPA